MTTYFRVDVNIIAAIVLGIVLYIANRRLDKKDHLNRTFFIVGMIIIVQLLIETATVLINRQDVTWFIPLSNILHTLLFIVAPLLTFFWFHFIVAIFVIKRKLSRNQVAIRFLPVLINTIIALLSPINGWFFSIDSQNIYQRGPLFLFSAFITYIYLFYGFFIILKHKRQMMKADYVPLLIFGIMPFLGGVAQTLVYGILTMWSSVAFSLVIVMVFLQQRMMHLDGLTGVWTRSSFFYFLSQRLDQKPRPSLGMIYLDINGLKKVNDNYGHLQGDKMIIDMIRLIRENLLPQDVIARLGGDEFIIVIECKEKEKLNEIVSKIKESFKSYKESNSEITYEFSCSFGVEVFTSEFDSIESFIHHIDELMYEDKRSYSN